MNIISSPTPPAIGQPVTGTRADSGAVVTTLPAIRLTPWQADSFGVETNLVTTVDGRYLVIFPLQRPQEVYMHHFPCQAPKTAEAAAATAASIAPFGGINSHFAQYSMTSEKCNTYTSELGEIAGGKA